MQRGAVQAERCRAGREEGHARRPRTRARSHLVGRTDVSPRSALSSVLLPAPVLPTTTTDTFTCSIPARSLSSCCRREAMTRSAAQPPLELRCCWS